MEGLNHLLHVRAVVEVTVGTAAPVLALGRRLRQLLLRGATERGQHVAREQLALVEDIETESIFGGGRKLGRVAGV